MGLKVTIAEDEAAVLWEDHLPAWRAWCTVSGQWRTQVAMVAASGAAVTRVIWLGLDYAAARAGLEMAGIDVTPGLWAEVREIEAGAREELNRGR